MSDIEQAFRLVSVTSTCLVIDEFNRPAGSEAKPEFAATLERHLFFLIEPRAELETISRGLRKQYGLSEVQDELVGGLHPERLSILCMEETDWLEVYVGVIRSLASLGYFDPFKGFESAENLFKEDRGYFDRILLEHFGILNVIGED